MRRADKLPQISDDGLFRRLPARKLLPMTRRPLFNGTHTRQPERLAQVAEDVGFDAVMSRAITVGATRGDVRGVLEHAMHDSEHHLGDVDHGLARLRIQLNRRSRPAGSAPSRPARGLISAGGSIRSPDVAP